MKVVMQGVNLRPELLTLVKGFLYFASERHDVGCRSHGYSDKDKILSGAHMLSLCIYMAAYHFLFHFLL